MIDRPHGSAVVWDNIIKMVSGTDEPLSLGSDEAHFSMQFDINLNGYLSYKRRGLYLCSAKTPLLEGSDNRRLYPLKGTSFDRVYVVFGARVDLGFFAIRQKRIRGGSTYAECNSGSLKEHLLLGRPRHWLTATPG